MNSRSRLFATAVILLAVASCAGKPGGHDDPRALLRQASTEAAERNAAGAADLYAQAVTAAIDAGACREAGEGARGLLETVYLSLDPAPLNAAEAKIEEAFPASACLFEAVTQVALARDLMGDGPKGREDLDRARAAAPDSLVALRLDRAIRIYDRDPETVLRGVRALSMPVGPEDTLWAASDSAVADRPDQVRSGRQYWRGPADASLTVRSALLIENLYILIVVRDDDLLTREDVRDSVLVALNPQRGVSSFHRRDPWARNTTMLFSIPTATSEAPQALREGSHTWYRTWRTADGFAQLVCIPKASVPEFSTSEGDGYCFDVIFHDRDRDGDSVIRIWEVDPDPRDLFLAGTLMLPDDIR